ncbi:glycoside hydrolase domain-containing protein [Arthrobacter sp. MMS24-S77]
MQSGHTAVRPELSGHPEVECGTGAWDKLLYGNHRFVVRVDAEGAQADAEAVQADGTRSTTGVIASRVILPWRRQDADPASVEIIVVSAESGRRVRNVVVERAERESGQLVFEPVDGPGDYWFYYLPYAMLGKPHYPQAQYLPRRPSADPLWAAAVEQSAWHLQPTRLPALHIPSARVISYEAASARDSFAPMNFTATADEVAALREQHCTEPFLLFPENRLTPISMRDALPAHWAIDGPRKEFNDVAQPGEDYIVRLGLYAMQDLTGVTVEMQPPTAGHCLNTAGTDRLGKPLSRTLTVPRGRVQALYTVLSVPIDAAGTALTANIAVAADGAAASTVTVTLDVLSLDDADPDIPDGGFGEPEYLRRLAWLDSTAAQDRELVAPFTQVLLDERGRTLSILGRHVRLAESGLPAQLTSTFTPSVTACDGPAVELFAAPLHFGVTLADPAGGKAPLRWSYSPLEFTADGPAQVSWRCRWTGRTGEPGSAGGPADVGLSAELRGTLEANGACTFSLHLTAGQPLEIDDAGLRLDFHEATVPLAMGLGVPGGRRPETLGWTWDVAKRNQDSLWLGSVNAGVQLALRDGNYERPLNTNFYREKPLVEPASWANRHNGTVQDGSVQDGSVRGGVALRTAGETVTVSAFSGNRTLATGEALDFDFRLLLTPFKPINPAKHLANRFFHAPAEPEAIAASGATLVNVHHATTPAPYINDPLLTAGKLAAYVEEAHRSGLRAKVYNTVRELTFHSPELLPLLSLGHEVFSDGPGLGHIWLQEHVGNGYVSAWFASDVDDIAVVTSGESRWENFYVRSLEELARRTGLDGIYLDDIAYDRHTMLRVRKVLERNCGTTDGPDIDLHSANQFTAQDGLVSSANLYMEHMPYVDRLWFGEYFDYENTSPEYWLVELSGIPFGLMGEMLEGGGNPWRGMVFGMTGRAPAVDNRPLWQFWANNGLEEATMIGHWASDAPIRSSNPEVLATTWLTPDGAAVVALASWAAEPVDVTLVFDGGATPALSAEGAAGLASSPVTVHSIEGFQTAASYGPGQPITLEPKRGLLLTIGKH